MRRESSSNQPSPLFATTRWSVVLAAGDSTAPESELALEELCRAYWYPLYAHIRGRGFSPDDAKDLTQDFIASLLRRESLSGVAPERGRFRSYLLAALKYFLADEHASHTAAKRGGGIAPISLEALSPEARYALEPASAESPDVLFDRRWAAERWARQGCIHGEA
jgi:RNA polymerase sigma-70 factor (ECF subfamily)